MVMYMNQELEKIEVYTLKECRTVDCLVEIHSKYIPAAFITCKYEEIKVVLSFIVLKGQVSSLEEILKTVIIPADLNLTEFIFREYRDFTGLLMIVSTKLDKRATNIESKVILGQDPGFSTDNILDMYKSACIFSHIGFPTSGIQMSCLTRGRDKGICVDENLLSLAFKQEWKTEESHGHVNGKIS